MGHLFPRPQPIPRRVFLLILELQPALRAIGSLPCDIIWLHAWRNVPENDVSLPKFPPPVNFSFLKRCSISALDLRGFVPRMAFSSNYIKFSFLLSPLLVISLASQQPVRFDMGAASSLSFIEIHSHIP